MIALDFQQGTEAWRAARCGIPTASNFDKIVTTTGAPSKQREKYLYQLAGERVTGRTEESYQNGAMQRGIEMEAEARSLYELINDVQIAQVGICYPDEQRLFAASPDGLVGQVGLIEIKCPLIYTHVGYLIAGVLPTEYFQQIQGQLLVTGAEWVDFISYYPGLRTLIVRMARDEEFLKKLAAELLKFCAELDVLAERIR